jgi:hypothetical protein
VVKVKGVTGIEQQHTIPASSGYCKVLKAVELNSDVDTLRNYAFRYMSALENIDMSNTTVTSIPNYCFMPCACLTNIALPNTLTTFSQQCFYYTTCLSEIIIPQSVTTIGTNTFIGSTCLTNVTIPSNVTSIGNSAFNSCVSLSEIHMQPTTPPTAGTGVFNNLPSNFIIYVPVGYGDTYKAASGWSTYADHILEEGQTPNRMMLAKFGSAGLGEEDEEMR